MNKSRLIKHIFSGILISLLSGSVGAAAITFTWASTGSGSIGATNFSDAGFVITAVADTENRVPFSGGGGFNLTHNTASIDISGVGTYTFITETGIYVNNDVSLSGFQLTDDGGDLLDAPENVAFSSWGLDTSIGPFTGAAWSGGWDDNEFPVNTTGGRLIFMGGTPSVTFEATVVPVPAAIWLFGSGLLGLVGMARRKKAA